ncbi:MAG: histidine kinase [Burkholderiales bacterium]|nr:histidine kinase [Burkholderiales bacterium]
MSTLAATAPARQPEKLTARTVLAAWRGITRQQVLVTFLLACGMFLYRTIVTINVDVAPVIFLGDQLKAFALLLTIVVADRVTGKDPDCRGPYVLALLVAGAVSVPITIFLIWGLIRLAAGVPVRPPGGVGFALNIFFEFAMVAGAVVWIINDRRRAARARARMHAAELQRIAAERRSIESDLQTMQARIEPQFLFNTLAQVKLSYARDHAQGERLLDALIAYLRAAMPKMRETSTVGQELDLVRAYLSIARLRMGDRLAFSIDTDARVANSRMPAMILLPLVDHAIAHAPTEWHAAGSVDLRATATTDAIRLEIVGIGIDLTVENGGVAGVRGRLQSLYGGNAALAFERRDAGESVAILRIPHE